MGKLTGKIAVITGGSRGLGFAMARAYAAEGAKVVIASRSQDSVGQAIVALRSEGFEAYGMACDVAVLSQVRALAQYAMDAYGRFDIWVNNAGVSVAYGPAMHVPADAAHTLINTNVVGAFNGSRVALEHFVPRGSGKLINVLGRGEDGRPVPNQGLYAASKAWLRSFTEALAKEYAESGVSVLMLQPGMMATEMLTRTEVVAGYEEQMKVLPTVVRLLGNPVEMAADKAVWLASPATDGKTGLRAAALGRFASMARAIGRLVGGLFNKPETGDFTVGVVQPEQPFGG